LYTASQNQQVVVAQTINWAR